MRAERYLYKHENTHIEAKGILWIVFMLKVKNFIVKKKCMLMLKGYFQQLLDVEIRRVVVSYRWLEREKRTKPALKCCRPRLMEEMLKYHTSEKFTRANPGSIWQVIFVTFPLHTCNIFLGHMRAAETSCVLDHLINVSSYLLSFSSVCCFLLNVSKISGVNIRLF